MACTVLKTHFILRLVLAFSLIHMSLGSTRKLTGLWKPKIPPMDYHNGEVLTGKQQIITVWYGRFTPAQRAIICDFINSLSSPAPNEPSVTTWFSTLDKYYALTAGRISPSVSVSLGKQRYDKKYSLGKSLTQAQIEQIALSAKGKKSNVIVMVLTSADVSVEEFCMICGKHASCNGDLVYLWVGNSASLCPGTCAWPFHPAVYGPALALVPPNNDTGIDGMVINIASLLAGCITNPYGTGIFQGVANAPLEACSACPGVYGAGAYPGNPGQLLKDQGTGCSHNTYGINDRKYLVPAMFDPATLACLTLV